MRKADLVLIHAPSIYDFRKKVPHYGPISDVIPSTSVFDMYPMGFLSILSYLVRRGFRVRIVNLAVRMLLDPSLDVERMIGGIEGGVFGIDLHWMPHVQGALEVARIVKRLHEDKPVILGGLTSTIFWTEILSKYPQVDYVMLGDTVELPLALLVSRLIDKRGKIGEIPNLAWREGGKIRTSGIRWIPRTLDEFSIDYKLVLREVFRWRDVLSFLPFKDFISHPIGSVLAYKGCLYNCVTCGASKSFYAAYMGRCGLTHKSPERMIEEMKSILDYVNLPIFVLGDVNLLGAKKLHKLIKGVKEHRFDTIFFFEFYRPPQHELLDILKKIADAVIVQISPESHDERIRRVFGRPYGNKELEDFVKNVVIRGFKRLDLYFLIGIPLQTKSSVTETLRYLDSIMHRYKRCKTTIDPFIAPLAPFVDPGSLAFRYPEKYGYKLFFRTLDSHRDALEQARWWGDMLNYETRWMSKEEIIHASYDAARELLKLKIRYGILPEDEGMRKIKLLTLFKSLGSKIAGLRNLKPGVKETTLRQDLYPSKQLLSIIRPKLCKILLKSSISKD